MTARRQTRAVWVAALLCALIGVQAKAESAFGPHRPGPGKSGVGPNAVTLPTGPGSLLGFSAQYDWQLAGNKASWRYSVDIETPVGPAGIGPDIRLTYGSDLGTGALGLGWRLDLPFIERDTTRRLPIYAETQTDAELGEAVGDEGQGFRTHTSERLVRDRNGDYFAEHESAFIRYRRGDDGWLAQLPNGESLWFGTQAAARLEAGPGRTFRWLAERRVDSHGNEIRYDYDSAEPSTPGVTPRRRIRRIEYGAGPRPWKAWHEIVFDYEPRLDVINDAKPGFIEETATRLHQVDVRMRMGQNPGAPPEDRLVRRYRIDYEPPDALNGTSRLRAITEVGHDVESTLPPVTFRYTGEGAVPTGPVTAAQGTLETVLEGVTGIANADVALADVNADALPDVLITRGVNSGGHRAAMHLGIVAAKAGTRAQLRFDRSRPMSGDPRSARVRLGAVEHEATLADLDGDGRVDLAYRSHVGSRQVLHYFPAEGKQAWGERRALGAAATQPRRSGSGARWVRQADLDGDRRIDLLRSDAWGTTVQVWLCLGDGRYAESPLRWRCPKEGCDLSDPDLAVADATGDGMPDLVQATARGLKIATGLGFGRFTEYRRLGYPNGDVLPPNSVRRVTDVTGDGVADLVVGPDAGGEIRIAVNQAGAALGVWVVFRGVPAPGPWPWAQDWADMTGDGAVDYAVREDHGAGARIRVLDFVRALGIETKPGLMREVDNGRGHRIAITYTTAVAHMREAREAGTPWRSNIPHPLVVVDSVREDTYPNPAVKKTRYRYRDGVYSQMEREHRGFESIEAISVGTDAAHPTQIVRSTYERGDDYAALKSRVRSVTVTDASARAYGQVETVWSRPPRVLRRADEGAASVFAYAERTVHRRIGGDGQALITADTRYTYDDAGNVVERTETAASGPADSHAGAKAVRRTILREFITDEERWILHKPRRERVVDGTGVLVSERRLHYDDETFDPEAGATLTRGLRTMSRVRRTPGMGSAARDSEWVIEERVRHDPYGNPVLTFGPLAELDGTGAPTAANGHIVTIEIDPHFRTRVLRESIVVDADTTLMHRFDYDDRLGAITTYTDPSGSKTRYAYDAFGRLIEIARPIDLASRPSMKFSYRVGAPTADGGAISWIETLLLNAPNEADDEDAYLRSRRYLDGAGRAVYTTGPGSGGIDGDAAATVVGLARFSARGSLIQSLSPCVAPPREEPLAWSNPFAPGWTCDWLIDGIWERRTLASAPRTDRRYDGFDRETEITSPDGAVRRIRYRPLERTFEDENVVASAAGAALVIRSDGLGRIVEMVETPRIADDGTPTAHRQAWSTHFVYDARDLLVSIRDAIGRTRRTAHDGLGRVVRIESPDFGTIDLTYDDASNLIEEVDTRGRSTRYTYDGARRLIASNATASDATPISTRYVYDLHRSGRLSRITDTFGTEDLFYDDRGRTVEIRRTVAASFGGSVYWVTNIYDPMDRLTSRSYPDGDRLRLTHDNRGLLTGISMASVGDILLDVDYSPDEQPVAIHFANGLVKQLHYDARARLTRTEVLQSKQLRPIFSEKLIHDPASNVVRRERQVADRHTIETFDYDDLHRLIAARRTGPQGDSKAWMYLYDKVGNRLRTTVNDALVWVTVGRDDTGRIVRVGNLEVAWNAEARLSSITGNGLELSSIYDYEGRRVLRRLPKHASSAAIEELKSPFSDYELHGMRIVKFVKLFGGLAATVQSTSPEGAKPSALHYHHTDHLGSSIIRFDGKGTMVGETAFTPFGAPELRRGVTSFGRGFTGAHQDTALGIAWFEARAMVSSTGRFMSPDPALIQVDLPPASPQALNPFSYSANRPLTHKDPDGRLFSLVVNAGFALYDTHQYLVGNMRRGQYAAAMSLNGAALVADVATVGAGGGLAVRAANLAIRGAKAVDKADTIYSSVNAAVHASREVRNGNYGRALLMGTVAGIGAKSVGTPRRMKGALARAKPFRGAWRLEQERLEHIGSRHWHSSGARRAGKFSQDIGGREIKHMIGNTVESGAWRQNTRGRPGFVFEHDFGRQIGKNSIGDVATKLRVVTDEAGSIITAFPF